jgi:hypothetical protein
MKRYISKHDVDDPVRIYHKLASLYI